MPDLRERESKRLHRFVTTFFLILSLLLQNFLFLVHPVYAATSPWTQSDWSGGSGQSNWSTTNKFSSSSGVTTSTANQATLSTQTEKLSNTGFESDLTGWDSASGITTNLVSYWKMEENSGTRVDATGRGNDLASNNSVAQADGIVGHAAGFAAASAQSLTRASTNDLVLAGTNWTIVAWVYPTSAGVDRTFISKVIDAGNSYEYYLEYVGAGNNLRVVVSSNGTGAGRVVLDNALSVSMNTWYCMMAWYDGTKLYLSINNAAAISANLSATFNGGYPFNVGRISPVGRYVNGRIDEVGIWKRVLTVAELSAVYNSGSGVTYPFYTTTRDTTTTYGGSAGSAKVVSNGTTTFTQSVNVGDTNTYNLSTYAYTTGAAVTSSDVSLYYNGSTVPTTYTADPTNVGWYHLTGTVTGVASSVGAGVQVESGKTVYLDNVSLNNYSSSGTLTSSIFDTGQQSDWGTLTYSATTPTNTSVAVRVRTSNNADMTGATAFASCTAISSGASIGSNACATNGQRYVQYQLTLSTTDTSVTPTFTSISIPFTYSNAAALNDVSLDTALGNAYTNAERPSFKWNAPDTTLSGLASYSVSIDNGDTGSFTINNIPISGTQDVGTSKYSIHFEGFNDSNPTNNTITVTTKSSSDWNSSENDGKLREGKRNWTLTAYGNSGNTRSLSQTLFVDLTRATIGVTQINDTKLTQTPTKPLGTTARKPQIFGRITDPLAGDISSTRNNQIASGSKTVEVKLEKRNTLGTWDLHTLSTIQTPETFFSDTNRKITDNTLNTASKYAIFSFTPEEKLSYGDYKITITGKDTAGNQSQPISFTLTIAPFSQIVPQKEQKVIEQTITEEFPKAGPEEKQQLKEELNLVREVTPSPAGKPSAAQMLLPKLAGSVKGAYWTSVETTKALGSGAWHMITSAFNATGNTIALLADGLHRYKQFADASNQATNAFLASTYTAIAHQAPGIVGDGLVALGNGFSRAGNTVARLVNGTGSSLASYLSEATNPLVSNTGKTAHHLKVNLLATGEIWFDRNPTNITDVQVAEVGRDYAVITWKTTHYTTNNKVNYGETLAYGRDALDLERERLHRITVRPLKPETKYYFEVMSQNKNYVYDAHHEFTTGGRE